jgi:serine/threonine protein kinase
VISVDKEDTAASLPIPFFWHPADRCMSLVHDALHSESRTRIAHESPRQSDFSLPQGYEPLELAGMGAFAEVWKAVEIRTERICALKRLRPDRCDDATALQLIRNEAQACQAVSSPHLLKLLLAEPRAEVPFLVFEWLEGRTLEEELRDVGPLTLRRAVWMARQTADGMQDLERCGLAHGDIKPQNIFITLGGEVKLLDLGFVRSIAAMPGPGAAATLLGTPEYLAPESLVSGVALPVAKDMYALGVTLYRMLTGRLPFAGDSPAELMVQHRQVKPTLLRRHRPDAPRELSDLVGKMLAKQPFRRPHNLRSLIRALVDMEISLLTSELAHDA